MSDAFDVSSCKTTTSTTGTNPYVLDTANLASPHRTPKQAVLSGILNDGDRIVYKCVDTTVDGDDPGGIDFEFGEGTYDDTLNTVSRLAADIYDSPLGAGQLHSWPGSGVRDFLLVGIVPSKLARLDRENTFSERMGIGVAPGTTYFGINPVLALEGETSGFSIDSTTTGTTSSIIFAGGGTQKWLLSSRNNFGGAADELILFSNAGGEVIRFEQSGRVGIGMPGIIPDGELHIHTSSAGAVTADSQANDLIIESSAITFGMTFLGSNISIQRIVFADVDNNVRAFIEYQHSDDEFNFRVANTPAGIWDENGLMLGNVVRGTARLKLGFNDKDLELVDATTTGVTNDVAVEITVGGTTFFLRGFLTK